MTQQPQPYVPKPGDVVQVEGLEGVFAVIDCGLSTVTLMSQATGKQLVAGWKTVRLVQRDQEHGNA